MPTFTYKALTPDGHDVRGELEAADRAAALRELASCDTCVTDIAEKAEGVASRLHPGGAARGIRLRPKRLATLTRQLATSLDAGLPLMDALDVIGRELDHVPSRELLLQLGRRVQHGTSLSDAMAEHPATFPPLYLRLVRVGETGGMLDQVLAQLADMLDRQIDLRERVKTASIYPSIVLLLGLASVVIIVTFIVPRIMATIDTESFRLPLPTRMLVALGEMFRGYWWLLLGGVAAAVIAVRQGVLRGPARPAWDAAQLRLPILGRLIRQLEAARFARSMGILSAGGVTLTQALGVVRDTIQNGAIRGAVYDLSESIASGESIAGPLQRSGMFPPLLVQMVRVGENTGRLDDMLLRAADVHESQARVTLDRLVSVLPVLMILVLAIVIGFIVAGLVLAIVEFQTMGIGAPIH